MDEDNLVNQLLLAQDAIIARHVGPLTTELNNYSAELLLDVPSRETGVALLTRYDSIWREAIAEASPIMLVPVVPELKALADVLSQLATDYLQYYGLTRAKQIEETGNAQLRRAILRAQRRGATRQQIEAELVEAMPKLNAIRASTIVETEVHSATQFAVHELAIRSAIPLTKRWHAVIDDRTRRLPRDTYGHLQMHGTKVGLEIPYRVPVRSGGSEELMYPGDPNGGAGNVIRCRCTQIYERADR